MASIEILKYCIECDTKYEFGSKFCLVCETKINENIRTIEEEGMQQVTGFSNYLEVNHKKKTSVSSTQTATSKLFKKVNGEKPLAQYEVQWIVKKANSDKHLA